MARENQTASEEIMGCCPRPTASYKSADVRMSNNWFPPDRSANDTVLPEKRRIDAQTKDAARNCEFIDGAIRHNTEAAIGDQLRIKPMPERDVLGLDAAQHWEFIQRIKKLYKRDTESKSNWVDITGRNSATELWYMHTRNFLSCGESLALFYWRDDDTLAPFRTSIGMIDVGRLRTPNDFDNDKNVIAGIRYDSNGAAEGYYIHDYHINDSRRLTDGLDRYEYIPARDDLGREQVVHCYHQTSPELSRGVSQFACALRTIKKMEKYTDAQIESAIIQTMIAATIESDMPDAGDILNVGDVGEDPEACRNQYMRESIDYHNENNFTFNGSKVVKLYDKEKFKLSTAGKFANNYEDFSKSMWAGVARCFGLSLETFTQDWGDTSFSGARAGFLSMWRHIEWLRSTVPADFAHRFYCVWLEEQIANGRLLVPGMSPGEAWIAFQANRDAFTGAKFFGSARDEIDREKTAKAYQVEKELGVFTEERYCNEVLAEDWCDVKEQQIIEELFCQSLREQYGLAPEVEDPTETETVTNE